MQRSGPLPEVIMFPVPNYTQIPNLILDDLLPLMKEAEMRIFMVICRQTIGWHRREHQISLSFFEKATGLCRQGVLNGIEEAIKRNTIIKREGGPNKASYYSINIDYSSAPKTDIEEINTSLLSRPEGSLRNGLEVVHEVDTKKERVKEKKIVCPSAPVGPSGAEKRVEKITTHGQKIALNFDDLIKKSIQQNKDWTLAEITQAWQILQAYDGRVNDLDGFMEGTIEQNRKKKKLETMNKASEACQKQSQKVTLTQGRPPTQEEILRLSQPNYFAAHLKRQEPDSKAPHSPASR